jgi:hypothetical protein
MPTSFQFPSLGDYTEKTKGYANSAKGYASRMRSFANDGLFNRSMARADRIALETGNYKPLARLAGRRSIWSRVTSGPGHEMGKQWAKWSVGVGMEGVHGSGFDRMGAVVKPTVSEMRAMGYSGRKIVSSKLMSGVFRALGAGVTAYAAYEGYKKEGAWGAVKGAGTAIGEQYLLGRAIGGVLGSAAIPIAAGGALAYGGLTALGQGLSDPLAFSSLRGHLRERTYEYRKKNAELDLGSPSVDPFGNSATMRQRSVNAIQNSRLNGRSALSNEATILHQPYFR